MILFQRFDKLWIAAELAHVQVVIKTFFLQKFFMFASFDNLAIIDHQHHVCIADRAQAVGDDKTRATFQQCGQGFLDQTLGARVHTGGCFVEDEDAWIRQGGTGNGQQLALPLAEAGASFSQYGLVLLRQTLNESVGVG